MDKEQEKLLKKIGEQSQAEMERMRKEYQTEVDRLIKFNNNYMEKLSENIKEFIKVEINDQMANK